MLAGDPAVRRFFEGETSEIPDYYAGKIRQQLGPLWEHLPSGALRHDPNAYLKEHEAGLARNEQRAPLMSTG